MAITRTALGLRRQATSGTDLMLTVANQLASVTANSCIVIGVGWRGTAPGLPVCTWDDGAGKVRTLHPVGQMRNANIHMAMFSAKNINTADDRDFKLVWPASVDRKVMAVTMIEGTTGQREGDSFRAMDSTTDPGSGGTGTSSITSEIAVGFLVSNGPQGDDAGTPGNSYTAGQRGGTVGAPVANNVTIQEVYRIADFSGGTAAQLADATSRNWASGVGLFPEGIHPTLLGTIELRVPDYFVLESEGVAGAIAKLEEDLETRFPPQYEVVSVTVVEE